jgi:NAD(P)-dependent dehydrogenase (short-subunit alcohol dehydrogenase family)
MSSRSGRARTHIAGTVAVVTGAGRGIGRATALSLAARGATVVCADLDGEGAEKVAAACGERGPAGHGVTVDVASRPDLAELAGRIERDWGAVGIVVNNAGVGMSGHFTDMTAADWEWIRSINLDGVLNGCAVFGPRLLEQGRGHVVNLSSGLGYLPTATEPAYATTKAAVLALSQSLRADWRRFGVGVSAICPGVINTPIVEHTRFVGDTQAARRARAVKLFRRGHPPERVAAAVIGAIQRDRAVVPVGAEARFGWYMHRFAPVAVQQLLARISTLEEGR